MYTLTDGEKVPVSLSAVSTSITNEMTLITQWTTKPVAIVCTCDVQHPTEGQLPRQVDELFGLLPTYHASYQYFITA